MTNYVFHQETPMQNVEEMTQITMPMASGGEVKPRKMEEGGGTFYDYGYGTYNPATGYFDTTPELQNEQVRLEQELQNRQGTASRPATAAELQFLQNRAQVEAATATGGEQGAYAGYAGGGGGGEMGAGDTNFSQEYIDYLMEQANRSSTTDTSAADAAAAAEAAAAEAAAALAEFNERFSGGLLTPEEIQELIDGGMTEEQVLTLIGNYELSEDQLGQLYTQGLLTEEQIAQIMGLIDEATDEGDIVTEEDVADAIASGGYTKEEIDQMLADQLEEYNPDLSQYATQKQLDSYATQEQLTGLEGQFQNYLTPEQLAGYLPQEGDYITPEQLAEATANDYDEVIEGLTTQLSDLQTKYEDVSSQYEADAVNQQISDTKDELNSFFARSAPTGGQTGSTSQFSSGTSFLPGGSPMANLIGSQRENSGQDAFNSYLKTFTPSYASYEEPKSLDDYAQGSNPFMGAQYNNPFTGGYNMGGQVSNGIMDLTNFDTNVQPFQNAFRPNKPRN